MFFKGLDNNMLMVSGSISIFEIRLGVHFHLLILIFSPTENLGNDRLHDVQA